MLEAIVLLVSSCVLVQATYWNGYHPYASTYHYVKPYSSVWPAVVAPRTVVSFSSSGPSYYPWTSSVYYRTFPLSVYNTLLKTTNVTQTENGKKQKIDHIYKPYLKWYHPLTWIYQGSVQHFPKTGTNETVAATTEMKANSTAKREVGLEREEEPTTSTTIAPKVARKRKAKKKRA